MHTFISFDFTKVWLKGWENSSEHHEIFHALLSNYKYHKNMCACLSTKWDIGAFAKVALKGSENSSERYESWHVHLFIEMGTYIHFQISILKKSAKVHIFNLGLTILD